MIALPCSTKPPGGPHCWLLFPCHAATHNCCNHCILILLYLLCVRAKTPSKGKSTNKSNKSSQKSKKAPTKARVVWEDNTAQNAQTANSDTSTNSTDLNQPRLNDPAGKLNWYKNPKIHVVSYIVTYCISVLVLQAGRLLGFMQWNWLTTRLEICTCLVFKIPSLA